MALFALPYKSHTFWNLHTQISNLFIYGFTNHSTYITETASASEMSWFDIWRIQMRWRLPSFCCVFWWSRWDKSERSPHWTLVFQHLMTIYKWHYNPTIATQARNIGTVIYSFLLSPSCSPNEPNTTKSILLSSESSWQVLSHIYCSFVGPGFH